MPAKTKVRTTHWLRRNHGSGVPRNLVFVTIKSEKRGAADRADEQIGRLDFGIAHAVRYEDGRIQRWQKLTFNSSEQFWTWFHARHRSNTSLWLIGHKIAQSFTLLHGWDLVDRGFYSLTSPTYSKGAKGKDEKKEPFAPAGWFVDADPPTIILLHAKGCVVHVVDIRNYGNFTLREMAKATDEPLGEQPKPDADYRSWESYVNESCIVVREWFLRLIGFWQANDLGVWRHTAASLALAAYRHRHLSSKILIHDCTAALELERESLVGGEFRSFYCGHVDRWTLGQTPASQRSQAMEKRSRIGPVYTLDVNSLYPAVMSSELYPAQLAAWKEQGSIEDYRMWSEKLLIIARVKVRALTDPYPCISENERYHALGEFWTTLAGPELERAVERGEVIAWGRIAPYYPGRLFVSFVQWFHAERIKAMVAGNRTDDMFHKLLLNSLAGKWGQRAPRWEFDDMPAPPNLRYGTFAAINDEGEIRNYRAIAGYTQVEEIAGEALESAPAIEAFINAYGREKMRLMRSAVRRGQIFYMASDTLHVDAVGRQELAGFLESTPGELGKLRQTGQYETAVYRGIHDYDLDDKRTIAGASDDAEFDRHDNFKQNEEESLRSIILREPGGFLRIKTIVKRHGGFHPRGIWHSDGRVSPPVWIDGILRSDHRAFQWLERQRKSSGISNGQAP